MFSSNITRAVLAIGFVSLICCAPASSRQWRATPDAVARDYATINDNRLAESVNLTWFVPQMMQPGATGLIAMTQKYVILMVSHSRVDKATGTNAFEDISALEPKDQSGKPPSSPGWKLTAKA